MIKMIWQAIKWNNNKHFAKSKLLLQFHTHNHNDFTSWYNYDVLCNQAKQFLSSENQHFSLPHSFFNQWTPFFYFKF